MKIFDSHDFSVTGQSRQKMLKSWKRLHKFSVAMNRATGAVFTLASSATGLEKTYHYSRQYDQVLLTRKNSLFKQNLLACYCLHFQSQNSSRVHCPYFWYELLHAPIRIQKLLDNLQKKKTQTQTQTQTWQYKCTSTCYDVQPAWCIISWCEMNRERNLNN